MFKYLVITEDYDVIGLDDDEMAREVAEFNIVVNVQTSKTLESESEEAREIKTWAASFPRAIVGDAFGNRDEGDTEPPASLTIKD